MKKCNLELYNDNFQNFKVYGIPRAQLIIADIPYNLADNFYASRPEWYIDGDNKNGESKNARAQAFNTDKNFNIAEYMHFCSTMLIKEPKEPNKAPAMIVFCAFEQMQTVIEQGKKYGFMNSYPLVFIKNYSAQVLKANMKIVGATEYAVVLYRGKLPKFNGGGKMVFNWFDWKQDKDIPKLHTTQKPVALLKKLIEIFTDEGDVVIDPVAGSASTLRAAAELNRSAYGFEIDKQCYKTAKEKMLKNIPICFENILYDERVKRHQDSFINLDAKKNKAGG
jgi:site-specific DNA-methyltransferase (adenine-specific)